MPPNQRRPEPSQQTQRPPLNPRQPSPPPQRNSRPPAPPPNEPPQQKRRRLPGPAAAFLPDARGRGGQPPLLALAGPDSDGTAYGGASRDAAARASQRAEAVSNFAARCWLDALEAAGMPGGVFAPAGPPLQPSIDDITSGAPQPHPPPAAWPSQGARPPLRPG